MHLYYKNQLLNWGYKAGIIEKLKSSPLQNAMHTEPIFKKLSIFKYVIYCQLIN